MKQKQIFQVNWLLNVIFWTYKIAKAFRMEFFENSATVCSFENIPTGEYLFESYISFTSHVLTFLFRSLSMEQTTAEFRPEFKSQK